MALTVSRTTLNAFLYFFYVSKSSVLESLLIRVIFLGFFGVAIFLSHFDSLPEVIKALLASVYTIVFPLFLGHDLLSIGNYDSKKSNLHTISKLTVSWALGSLLVLHLVNFSKILNIDFMGVVFLTLVVLTLGSIHKSPLFDGLTIRRLLQLTRNLKTVKPLLQSSPKTKLILITILILIGISSVSLFRTEQPYPTYLSSEFHHFGKSIQLIDGMEGYKIAEPVYFHIYQTAQAVSSILFDVHPAGILWMSAFPLSIIVAAGVFFAAKALFKRNIPSLIAAFLAMWIIGGTPVQNNPYVVSNANLQYAFFILAFYITSKNLPKIRMDKYTILVPLGFATAIFFQRLAIGQESALATIIITVLPFALMMYKRNDLIYGGKFQMPLILLILLTLIVMLHPFQAPLFIIILLSYIALWKFVVGDRKS